MDDIKSWSFVIFNEHFLNSQYDYMQMSELIMSSPHFFPCFVYKILINTVNSA